MRMRIHVMTAPGAAAASVTSRGVTRGRVTDWRTEERVTAGKVITGRVIAGRVAVGRVAAGRKALSADNAGDSAAAATEAGAATAQAVAATAVAAAAAQPRKRRQRKPKEEEKDAAAAAAQYAYNADGSPPVVILLDFETTGRGARQNRIVEMALRDVAGGQASALHTLVNPYPWQITPGAQEVHGISMRMVNQPSVPRWPAAGQLLVDFVEARRAVQAVRNEVARGEVAGGAVLLQGSTAAGADGLTPQAVPMPISQNSMATIAATHSSTGMGAGMDAGVGAVMGVASSASLSLDSHTVSLPPVVLVAHNGHAFDFPLLRNELERADIAMPPGWLCLDSMRLCQRLFKGGDRKPASKSLSFLFSHHFRCSTPFAHRDLAHRAMADVDKLAEVLSAMMWERGVTVPELLQYTKPFL
ncbi:hypothetical protein CLOP_g9866 [Closterium sp. NIES-67]|nr:hypothetical protein CLOP_g9866 [Closterium sp. NIES-67]